MVPVLVACGSMGNAAGAVLYFQSFESTAPSNAWSYTTSGVAAVSSVAGATDTPANGRIQDGSSSLQVNNGAGTVTFDSVDVSLYNNLSITLRVSGTSTTSGNGLDAPDFVRLFTSIDGAAFVGDTAAGADISLTGLANARWGFDATNVATTDAGTHLAVGSTSGTSKDNYSTFVINIPDAASLVALRLSLFNDNSGEVWNVDSVTLNGTLAAPEPSRMLLLMVGLWGAVWRRRRSPLRLE